MRQILITKQDGTEELFDARKLRTSLLRSGASDNDTENVIKKIKKELKDRMKTSEIYENAFSYLKHKEKPVAARYSMKRALLALGPSGYPFEDFVAEIFKANGYEKVEVGVNVQGACVEHEVDMLAEKDGKRIGAEMKFHNKLDFPSDLKVALYVHARFEDIRKKEEKENKKTISEDWLITNTRFSKDAIKYGKCVGMKMVSWNYPKGEGLQDLIERAGVHPITALTALTSVEKVSLLKSGIVLCRNLKSNKDVLESIGLKGEKLKEIIKESEALCKV